MELKVWVEGIQRIVCGVTISTTCQDVVFALAHATGKVGRFTLIERWRNNERLLAPNEKPLKLLLKWGEYANNVQFILLRSDAKPSHSNQNQGQLQQQQHSQPVEQQQLVNFTNSSDNTVVMTNKIPLATNNIINSCNTNITCNYNDIHKSNDNDNNKSKSNNNSNSNNENDNENTINYPPHTKLPTSMEVRLNAAHERAQQLKKSFSAHDVKLLENVGVVKGVQQNNANNHSNKRNHKQSSPNEHSTQNPQHKAQHSYQQQQRREQSFIMDSTPLVHHEKSYSNPIEMSTVGGGGGGGGEGDNQTADIHQRISNNDSNSSSNNSNQRLGLRNSKSINAINLRDGDNNDYTTALTITTSTTAASSITVITTTPATATESMIMGSGNILEIFNDNLQSINLNSSTNANSNKFPHYQQTPAISANGALVPPPYRDPPPPHNPLQQQYNVQQPITDPMPQSSNSVYTNKETIYDVVDYDCLNDNFQLSQPTLSQIDESKSIFQATQYNDLLQLIKCQREKITNQQLELTKYDAEIVYFEKKEHEQVQELESISREVTLVDQILRQGSEQLQTLQYVEEENELVKQQEKTLKSEIALLRSKLANCETELLQCKNKIRLLMDDIEMEQRSVNSKTESKRQNAERDFLIEMESIQNEIDQAIENADATNKTAENLKKEIQLIENAIADKKRQVEQLVNEMKEVNLQSLAVTTSEEIKHLLEGSNKAGSSRRIIGSPRQLENAVPTSKNPHGVWV